MDTEQCSKSFTVTITDSKLEKKDILFSDPKVTGQQVVELAGYFPANDHLLLVRKPNNMLEEVNLREIIDLSKQEDNTVFLFKSDRFFYVEVNERRYPWGEKYLSKSAIRNLGNIPEGHNIFLEQRETSDLLIDDCSIVNLDEKGLERIYSVEQELKIIINGRPLKVETGELTFLELVKLAFPNTTVCQNIAYTITYTRGCKDKPEGSMVQGDSVCLKNGEVFNVTATSKS